jgi:hypothetical protein
MIGADIFDADPESSLFRLWTAMNAHPPLRRDTLSAGPDGLEESPDDGLARRCGEASETIRLERRRARQDHAEVPGTG